MATFLIAKRTPERYHRSPMTVTILTGDARAKLAELPDGSVRCCVTSPPYYGLRDYGTATWDGGDPACEHKHGRDNTNHAGNIGPRNESGNAFRNSSRYVEQGNAPGRTCKCGATRIDAQMGLEATPDAYVAAMVAVFREVRRVLSDDGVLFLNLGDSYASNDMAMQQVRERENQAPGKGAVRQMLRSDLQSDLLRDSGQQGTRPHDGSEVASGEQGESQRSSDREAARAAAASDRDVGRQVRVLRGDGTSVSNVGSCPERRESHSAFDTARHSQTSGARGVPEGQVPDSLLELQRGQGFGWPLSAPIKAKDLIGIPWMVALALRADGWYLRSDIIWAKPNPMPESVTDRPTKSHEYLFLLSKQGKYFYDSAAIAEEVTESTVDRLTQPTLSGQTGSWRVPGKTNGAMKAVGTTATRNRRTVWTVATQPFPGSHFATFPPALIEPCILAGTSAKGQCPDCGAPWVRETETTRSFESGSGRSGNAIAGKNGAKLQGGGETIDVRRGPVVSSVTTGWSPSCAHGLDPVPDVVLDPFGGAGTTGLVADRFGRDAVLIELNPEYAAMAERRIHNDCPLFAEVTT